MKSLIHLHRMYHNVIIFQAVEKKGEEHDLERTLRSVVIGSFYTAPAATFFYNSVDKVVVQSTIHSLFELCAHNGPCLWYRKGQYIPTKQGSISGKTKPCFKPPNPPPPIILSYLRYLAHLNLRSMP